MNRINQQDLTATAAAIKRLAQELGFSAISVTDLELGEHPSRFAKALAAHWHGEMDYLQRTADLRAQGDALLPGAKRAIMVRLDYLWPDTDPLGVLDDPSLGYVSRYALGRDYHKLMRRRLAKLADLAAHWLTTQWPQAPAQFRACVDSAPVLEKALAERAGLGWFGKHGLILNRDAGSWFFLGVLLTNLELPCDPAQAREHCGSCRACIDICPTQAIVGDRKLDARRCISYLTIELRGVIPLEFRHAIGNRIFGCDDCQLVCPWNRYAQVPGEVAFKPRHRLDRSALLELAAWDEASFLKNTEGMAIRRINFIQWRRNLAIALGNAPYDERIVHCLTEWSMDANNLIAEHARWALAEQQGKRID